MENQPMHTPSHSVPPTQSFFDGGTPKTMFYFGLAVGIAASLIGNTVLGYSGVIRASAATTKVSAAADTNTNEPKPLPTPTDTQPQPAGAPVPGLRDSDHVLGNKKAKVVMIEYSDFQCPFCGRFHPTLVQIMKDFPNQVAWVYRHYPLSFHPNAEPAANASECASEQGKFWEFSDKLFANQDALSDSFYEKTATGLGLNLTKFKTCYSAKKYSSRIASDSAEGTASGVNGTPATFINGQLVSGALPYESIKQMVQAALNQ